MSSTENLEQDNFCIFSAIDYLSLLQNIHEK